MSLIALKKDLEKKGYTVEMVKYINHDGRVIDILRVIHNYDGLYTPFEVYDIMHKVAAIAKKAGHAVETRSSHTATLIF